VYLALCLLGWDNYVVVICMLFAIENLIKSFHSVLYSSFQAHEQMKYQAITNTLLNVLTLVFIVIVTFTDFGLMGITFAYIFANIAGLIYAVLAIRKHIIKPKFSFSGSGGEDLRGSPGQTIKDYIENVSSKTKITNHEEEFYNSSKRLMERSVAFLKKFKSYNNEYEISYDLYSRIVGRNHFGKSALEAFIVNIYSIQPLMDPDLKKIKYNITGNESHDLISYIYIRFAHLLMYKTLHSGGI
jgi:hypothetical protein